MSWIALSLAALFGLLLAGVLYVYGWFGRRPSIDPTFALPVEGDETGIDKQLAPLLEAARSGENAVALISDNIEAFVARALSARRAGRSLDLQYYYWKDDLTGFLLTREVIRAADRGVRVRLLLDDVNAGIHDRLCISLDAHPNVDVRLFNPSRARTDRFRRGFELAIRAFSATRRMHNKLWIADGRLAISGGTQYRRRLFRRGRTGELPRPRCLDGRSGRRSGDGHVRPLLEQSVGAADCGAENAA